LKQSIAIAVTTSKNVGEKPSQCAIVSLSSSVIYHFGDIPDPVTRKAEKNLIAAKQTIDILGIIEQKTKGNLDENEKRLMDAILFELRMRYVKEAEKP